jgi:hypothetical protein
VNFTEYPRVFMPANTSGYSSISLGFKLTLLPFIGTMGYGLDAVGDHHHFREPGLNTERCARGGL